MNLRSPAVASCTLVISLGLASRALAQYDCTGIAPSQNSVLASVPVVTGVSQPVFATSPPGDTARLFVVERGGRIKIHKHGQPSGTTSVFLDISTKVDSVSDLEMGLLGLAFDPIFATTRFFWVDYTETVSGQVYTVIARYTASAVNPDTADPASEVRVLRIPKPETNHDGGMLTFGPDGFLYIFPGDGGGGGDAHGTCGNGQNLGALLGKILRIDVRGVDLAATAPDCGMPGASYGVPSTNPFRDGPSTGRCDEIWAYGLRNPWRSTFDAGTNDLYVADVGQNCWEEIDFIAAGNNGGQNFGWRQMEGFHCYNPADQSTCDPAGAVCGSSPACNDPSLTAPVLNYGHTAAGECAITGGYVYRGCRMPAFRGTYFYGDYCAGFVRTLVMSGGVATNQKDVTSDVDPGHTLSGGFSSFGVDGQGEMYAMSLGGTVRKLVPPFSQLEVSGQGAADMLLLSKTGSWTWEDVFLRTDVPVSFYRVYRGTLLGTYSCTLKTTVPSWPSGGDPVVPVPGQLLTFVVTAVNSSGVESKKGTTGTFNSSTCP